MLKAVMEKIFVIPAMDNTIGNTAEHSYQILSSRSNEAYSRMLLHAVDAAQIGPKIY